MKIKRKSGAPIFVRSFVRSEEERRTWTKRKKRKRRRKRTRRKKDGDEGHDEKDVEERRIPDESDGANDSLMKAEAARQKASLVFRSARVLLRHRSHPLCVYTYIYIRVYGVSLTNCTRL